MQVCRLRSIPLPSSNIPDNMPEVSPGRTGLAPSISLSHGPNRTGPAYRNMQGVPSPEDQRTRHSGLLSSDQRQHARGSCVRVGGPVPAGLRQPVATPRLYSGRASLLRAGVLSASGRAGGNNFIAPSLPGDQAVNTHATRAPAPPYSYSGGEGLVDRTIRLSKGDDRALPGRWGGEAEETGHSEESGQYPDGP